MSQAKQDLVPDASVNNNFSSNTDNPDLEQMKIKEVLLSNLVGPENIWPDRSYLSNDSIVVKPFALSFKSNKNSELFLTSSVINC